MAARERTDGPPLHQHQRLSINHSRSAPLRSIRSLARSLVRSLSWSLSWSLARPISGCRNATILRSQPRPSSFSLNAFWLLAIANRSTSTIYQRQRVLLRHQAFKRSRAHTHTRTCEHLYIRCDASLTRHLKNRQR